MLRLTVGEIQVDRMDNVEDTKGNNGDKGYLLFFLWKMAKNRNF